MTCPNSLPGSVNYTSIVFPSDRITLADLRRAHPERFDAEGGDRFKRSERDPSFALNSILYLERLLARAAFEQALGSSAGVIEDSGLDRHDCVKELASFYALYRVASGPHQTEQLIRDIESQAAAQAARGR